jgi:RNA polymerase primary sigma factor
MKLLTAKEEIELAQMIESGDAQAREKMINSNLRLAVKMAKDFTNRDVEFDDLLQESIMGLIKAVDRYEWRKGYRFSTYAFWWIRVTLQSHIANLSGFIKMPKNSRLIIFKMREFIKNYEEEFGVEPSIEDVAAALGTTPETLNSMVDCLKSPVRLQHPVSNGSDDSARNGESYISNEDCLYYDSFDDVESKIDRERLVSVVKNTLNKLTPREEMVIRLRFGISEEDYNDFKEKES